MAHASQYDKDEVQGVLGNVVFNVCIFNQFCNELYFIFIHFHLYIYISLLLFLLLFNSHYFMNLFLQRKVPHCKRGKWLDRKPH